MQEPNQLPFAAFMSPITRTVEINLRHYHIEQFISKGKFASVYEATDDNGDIVAVKLITPQGTNEKKVILYKRAIKEIAFLTDLKGSANVVTIRHSGVDGIVYFKFTRMDASRESLWKWSHSRPSDSVCSFLIECDTTNEGPKYCPFRSETSKHFAMWRCLESDGF